MDTIQCPACGTMNPLQAAACQECGEDLNTIKSVIDTANRHYNEALALAQGGNLNEAVGQLEAAIAMSSHNLNYHLLLGTVYAQKSNWDEAVRAWERCLALNPETEKAYHNIEKAHQMREEENAERRERPFFLTSIFSVAVCVFLLFTTAFYAYQAYSKNNKLSEFIELLNSKNTEINNLQQKFTTLSSEFPKEGLQGLVAQVTQWKTLADQRAASIDQLEKRYKDAVEARNNQIQSNNQKVQELQATISQQKQTIGQINPLRYSVTMKNKEIEKLQKTVADQTETLAANKSKIEQLTAQLNKVQTELAASKSTTIATVDGIRKDYDAKIEKRRKELQNALDEIAQKDRELSDIKYADKLVNEAVRMIQDNEFAKASGIVQQALDRRGDHGVALYYRDLLDRVLSNPVERELLVRQKAQRDAMREQIRSQIADRNLSTAKTHFDKGEFDRSIEIARQTLAFLPPDSSDAQRCNQIIRQAEEDEASLTRQLSEAKGYIESQDYRKAKALLKDIVRRAPGFEEASALLQKLP